MQLPSAPSASPFLPTLQARAQARRLLPFILPAAAFCRPYSTFAIHPPSPISPPAPPQLMVLDLDQPVSLPSTAVATKPPPQMLA